MNLDLRTFGLHALVADGGQEPETNTKVGALDVSSRTNCLASRLMVSCIFQLKNFDRSTRWRKSQLQSAKLEIQQATYIVYVWLQILWYYSDLWCLVMCYIHCYLILCRYLHGIHDFRWWLWFGSTGSSDSQSGLFYRFRSLRPETTGAWPNFGNNFLDWCKMTDSMCNLQSSFISDWHQRQCKSLRMNHWIIAPIELPPCCERSEPDEYRRVLQLIQRTQLVMSGLCKAFDWGRRDCCHSQRKLLARSIAFQTVSNGHVVKL